MPLAAAAAASVNRGQHNEFGELILSSLVAPGCVLTRIVKTGWGDAVVLNLRHLRSHTRRGANVLTRNHRLLEGRTLQAGPLFAPSVLARGRLCLCSRGSSTSRTAGGSVGLVARLFNERGLKYA